MNIKEQFKKIASYQSPNFLEHFGDMEYVEKKSKLYSKTLGRDMLDREILSEYKPTELELGEVFNLLSNDANKEDWMIFYCRNKDNIHWAVSASWGGVGWFLGAYSVGYPIGWRAGRQVFSRDSFDTVKLSNSDPVTLKHFDTSAVQSTLRSFIESLEQLEKSIKIEK